MNFYFISIFLFLIIRELELVVQPIVCSKVMQNFFSFLVSLKLYVYFHASFIPIYICIYLKASGVLANFVNKMQCCSNIYLPVSSFLCKKNLTIVLERFSSIGHSFAVLLNCTDGQQYLRLSKIYLKKRKIPLYLMT